GRQTFGISGRAEKTILFLIERDDPESVAQGLGAERGGESEVADRSGASGVGAGVADVVDMRREQHETSCLAPRPFRDEVDAEAQRGAVAMLRDGEAEPFVLLLEIRPRVGTTSRAAPLADGDVVAFDADGHCTGEL